MSAAVRLTLFGVVLAMTFVASYGIAEVVSPPELAERWIERIEPDPHTETDHG